jgi:hypothetical protein
MRSYYARETSILGRNSLDDGPALCRSPEDIIPVAIISWLDPRQLPLASPHCLQYVPIEDGFLKIRATLVGFASKSLPARTWIAGDRDKLRLGARRRLAFDKAIAKESAG